MTSQEGTPRIVHPLTPNGTCGIGPIVESVGVVWAGDAIEIFLTFSVHGFNLFILGSEGCVQFLEKGLQVLDPFTTNGIKNLIPTIPTPTPGHLQFLHLDKDFWTCKEPPNLDPNSFVLEIATKENRALTLGGVLLLQENHPQIKVEFAKIPIGCVLVDVACE